MKCTIVTLLLIIINFISYAQEFEVIGFEIVPNDLTARTNSRVDGNGRKCAVIKVYADDNIAAVRGAAIGDVVGIGMEKLVYMAHDSKAVELVFDHHLPLKIVFEDFGYPTITGQMTYQCKLRDITSNEHEIGIVTNENLEYANESIESIFGCKIILPSKNEFAIIKTENGLKVNDLHNGAFSDAGIKENFIIFEINGHKIKTPEDVLQIYDELKNQKPEERVMIIKGCYLNGRKGYYAVDLS